MLLCIKPNNINIVVSVLKFIIAKKIVLFNYFIVIGCKQYATWTFLIGKDIRCVIQLKYGSYFELDRKMITDNDIQKLTVL